MTKMASIDLILLHPPTLYDFRKRPGIYGPISDVVPSTPIFEMYPIGFASLSEYLERHGLKVRIINVAMKMLKDDKFDVERLIQKNKPVAFGIDLHWMAHVQGALALAEIIKRFHPKIPIILGGLSATYYHEEILHQYPFIDFVMRGDSTEKPLLQLLQTIKKGGDFKNIPNLTYRDRRNGIQANPLTHVPENLDEITIDYCHIMKKVVRYVDPTGYQPFLDWYTYPVTAVFTCRGCIYSCKTCGGSAQTFRTMANRRKPAYRNPKLLAQDIFNISDHLHAPVMIIGDIFQPGEEYGFTFLQEMKRRPITNHIAFEFFVPPSRAQLKKIAESISNFNIEISPESHDEEVRRAFGRPYNNESLERMLGDAIDLGSKRIDLFFMTGLPKQTYRSVLETVDYCRSLLERFRSYHKLFPFISPLAPFLDPGSIVFEAPEKYGYRLLYRTMEEHRQALLAPSWKYILNYETEWMNRDEIVFSTYEAGKRLNRLKAEFGLIDRKTAESVEMRLDGAVQMMKEIDRIMALPDPRERAHALESVSSGRLSLQHYSMSTICEKKELKWPTRFIRMNFVKILKTLLMRRKPNVSVPSSTGAP
ncbi:MAG: TIGR04190 family B12-binding domain/radical SAM domain protein [Deltaproteobacteria bacterium CG_4_8_14_3_um_filter_45_9]|jgi:B12-binding domain/radical SAM domain protein|nr:MAG: TIGR04190 family B12-binding domain/radical SAM domain protein [Deltaproteobacteria bacterium CG03_land_8_20_14_0_80_45_14]PIX24524.1 MAG: TIGR04190 family B12-binding domain/radical SAM domain protein [Deltaproteobacteria bacterium CG_4_8_14_3_um_filter_45_9]